MDTYHYIQLTQHHFFIIAVNLYVNWGKTITKTLLNVIVLPKKSIDPANSCPHGFSSGTDTPLRSRNTGL